MRNPVYVKVSIYSVYKYYINLGIVFRDKKKRYYTMEEVEQILIDHYKNIKGWGYRKKFYRGSERSQL